MRFADNVLLRLTKAIDYNYQKENFRLTLELISAKARLLYEYNQSYIDDQSELILKNVADQYRNSFIHNSDQNTVLFYDGFGLDTRGLVQQYLAALVANNYKVLYVTSAKNKEEQPQVFKILEKGNYEVVYSENLSVLDKVRWLADYCSSHSFATAFMYTTPWDVSGVVLFNLLKGWVTRYQINLTDHAFWLGINAFDFSLEFRNYGAAISKDYRGIDEKKLLRMPYYPVVNQNIQFQGFPMGFQGKKVLFSGGSPYKTIDSNGTYYKLIKTILDRHLDVAFLYAGNGTTKELNDLVKQYPQRAFHASERIDLTKVLENSRIFINTYPISGGLMLQYSAVSGCIPVTLKRIWDDDTDGILLDEESLHETYTDFNEVVAEIDRLIDDDDYYRVKKELLNSQVITEAEFSKRLKDILENPSKMAFDYIRSVDTRLYRKAYAEKLSEKDVIKCVINRDNLRASYIFPDLTIKRAILLLMEGLCK